SGGNGGAGDVPQVRQLQQVLGLFLALARSDQRTIKALTREMTLEQGALACFAVGQLLLRHLGQATGKSLEDLAAQISLEVGSSPA
ncbi:MAG TPA: hypothetical protein VII47_12535, partial [Actinomycetota bacterium]